VIPGTDYLWKSMKNAQRKEGRKREGKKKEEEGRRERYKNSNGHHYTKI